MYGKEKSHSSCLSEGNCTDYFKYCCHIINIPLSVWQCYWITQKPTETSQNNPHVQSRPDVSVSTRVPLPEASSDGGTTSPIVIFDDVAPIDSARLPVNLAVPPVNNAVPSINNTAPPVNNTAPPNRNADDAGGWECAISDSDSDSGSDADLITLTPEQAAVCFQVSLVYQ